MIICYFLVTPPFDSIDTSSDTYSDLNSSDRYVHIQFYKLLHPNEVRVPLILYVDKANIYNKGTIDFEPIMYTLGWRNQATRKLPQAWRSLGLTNDLDKKSIEYVKAKTVDKAFNYQSAVDKILESLVKVQKDNGIMFDLQYKGNEYRCRLTFVIQFMCGDMKASDQMCGRLAGHNILMARSSHDCDCKPIHNDDHRVKCKYVTRQEIKTLFLKKNPNNFLRTKYSQNNIKLAMYKLNFGECKHHIHGNAPMDFLHSLNLGIFNYALETLYGKDSLSQYCTDGDRYLLDQLSIFIGYHCKHQSDRTFERTNFVFVIISMSKTKGQEKSGVLLIILISLIVSDGFFFGKIQNVIKSI